MKPKYLIAAVAVLALFVFGAALAMRPGQPSLTADAQSAAQNTPASGEIHTTPTPPPGDSASPKPAGYTMAMVAQHNSGSSCWAAINGKVYDLTNWINQHPGGPEHILALCGTDGSAAFNAQHGGQTRPASELTNFYLGPLSQ